MVEIQEEAKVVEAVVEAEIIKVVEGIKVVKIIRIIHKVVVVILIILKEVVAVTTRTIKILKFPLSTQLEERWVAKEDEAVITIITTLTNRIMYCNYFAEISKILNARIPIVRDNTHLQRKIISKE